MPSVSSAVLIEGKLDDAIAFHNNKQNSECSWRTSAIFDWMPRLTWHGGELRVVRRIPRKIMYHGAQLTLSKPRGANKRNTRVH